MTDPSHFSSVSDIFSFNSNYCFLCVLSYQSYLVMLLYSLPWQGRRIQCLHFQFSMFVRSFSYAEFSAHHSLPSFEVRYYVGDRVIPRQTIRSDGLKSIGGMPKTVNRILEKIGVAEWGPATPPSQKISDPVWLTARSALAASIDALTCLGPFCKDPSSLRKRRALLQIEAPRLFGLEPRYREKPCG